MFRRSDLLYLRSTSGQRPFRNMTDISIRVLSATHEERDTARFSTKRKPTVVGTCTFMEYEHGEVGYLESSAGVGMSRRGGRLLEAGTYIFKLTGTPIFPRGERTVRGPGVLSSMSGKA